MIKLLKKIDIEFYLILFLLSGMFKNLFFSIYGNNIKIPLTIIFGILLILMIYIKDIYKLKRLKEEYKSFIFLLLFFVWSLFSISYSSSENYVWYKLLGLGTNFLAFFGVLIMKEISLKRFTIYFSYFTYFFSLIFFMINPNSISKNFIFHDYFNEIYIQGWYLVLGQFLIVNMLLIFSFSEKKKIIYNLLISLNIICLLGGRFPIVLALLVFFVISIYLIQKKYLTKKLLMQFFKTLTIIILINSVLNLSSKTYRSLLLRSIYRFEVLSSSFNDLNFLNDQENYQESLNQENNSFNKRLEYLLFSKTKIFENKSSLILGYGLGSFSNEYDQTDRRLYPHNIIVEIVFELGLIGLLLALAFLISNSSSYKGFFTNLALLAALTLLINSMKSSSIVDLRLLFALLAISIFHFNKLTLQN
ncbi:MAG: O-antigen ligase family protein [Parvicellaceae bacterium]